MAEVTDATGNLVSPNPTTLTATYPPSSARPTIKSAVSSSVAQVVVTFDRAMNTAAVGSGCANSANYSTTKADGTASGLGFGSVSCAANQLTLGLEARDEACVSGSAEERHRVPGPRWEPTSHGRPNERSSG